ncbi:hypothetical protein J4N45_09090 [Vibrio sp. SCSIO 43140]|uniref:DUF6933 domain-containing protein n=1 Tax=Vibrio sp. SCSIO 43140 TaxID=2819100 RepID=UPI0020758F0F|nr:hypothetical protein [Vibrio sp. SCSIO 43140]USD62089.1 hypothetical protein J4N45_09090 [Vibrio sp. SCSIO 43140]
MYQLRCTKKVQDVLGLKSSNLSEVKEESFVLGNWYVNTFTSNRRKCLLFMEEKTLMSFVLVGLRKEDHKGIGKVFQNGVNYLLKSEGISPEVLQAFENAPEQIEYTKTDSKQLLGNMNDLLATYEYFIHYDGGLGVCDLNEITMKINRTPQRNLDWKYSVDVLHEILGSAT